MKFSTQLLDILDFYPRSEVKHITFGKYIFRGNFIILPYKYTNPFFGVANNAVIFDVVKGLIYSCNPSAVRLEFSISELTKQSWFYLDKEGCHRVSQNYLVQNL